MCSLECGESSWLSSCALFHRVSPLNCSSDLESAEGDVTMGNLKFCGNDAEPFLLVNGAPPIPGVLGAVVIPVSRLNGKVESVPIGENEDRRRGEGCVEDLWPLGAVES